MTRLSAKNIITGALLALFAVVAGIVFTSETPTASAGPGDNVYGAAWAANDGHGMGWLLMNNCTDPTCPGPNYGVRLDPDTGDFTGQAWSENYGWVNFNSNSCGASPSVNFQDVIDNGWAWIDGWIHVHNAPNDGFWDGCIKMSGVAANNIDEYGVKLNYDGTLTGAAWGAEVVGWVVFDSGYNNVTTLSFGCTDPTADNYDPDAGIDDGSCKITQPGSFCTNIPWSTPENDNVVIDSQAELDLYNDTWNGTNPIHPVMVYDAGLCYEKGDVCPSNLDASAPVPYWNGIQTQAWFNAYNNDPNNAADLIIVGGYCVLETVTPPPTEICGNGLDDDGDGLIDEGCVGIIRPPSIEEI